MLKKGHARVLSGPPMPETRIYVPQGKRFISYVSQEERFSIQGCQSVVKALIHIV